MLGAVVRRFARKTSAFEPTDARNREIEPHGGTSGKLKGSGKGLRDFLPLIVMNTLR